MNVLAPRVVTARLGLPAVLAVAALQVAGYLGRSDSWRGVWTETETALAAALLFSVPAAVAAGAWFGGSLRRAGLDELSRFARIPQWRVRGREVFESVTWVCFGFIVGSLPAVALTAPEASYGRLQPTAVAADLAFLCAATIAGLWLGRHLPRTVASPVGAVATYVVMGFFTYSGGQLLPALTPVDQRWMTFHEVPTWVPIAQLGVWLTLVAVYVLGTVGTRSRLAALWLAGVLAAPLLYTGDADRQPDPEAYYLRCTAMQASVIVCLPAPKTYLAAPMRDYLGEFRRLTDGLWTQDLAVVDDEFSGNLPAGDLRIRHTVDTLEERHADVWLLSSFGDLSAYTQLNRSEFLFAVADFTLGRASYPAGDENPTEPGSTEKVTPDNDLAHASSPQRQPQASPRDVVLRFLLERLGVPFDGTAMPGAPDLTEASYDYTVARPHLEYLRGLGEEDLRDWFVRHRSDILSGRLRWPDLE